MSSPAESTPDADSRPLLQVRDLVKSYGDTTILRGVSFDLARGESLVILGRSGQGKSVTLRQLNGLEQPDSGSVLFDGTEVTGLTERQLVPVRKRMSMLFQSGALFDSMNVLDNISYALREHTDLDLDAIRERVAKSLALVRLRGIEDQMPSSLSGGMRKRVALARSLVLDPELVLFDEPTTGLDPVTSSAISELILDANTELGTSSVIVTHDLPLARRVGQTVAFLDDGRFRFYGTWAEAEDSDDPVLHGFLNGHPESDDVQ